MATSLPLAAMLAPTHFSAQAFISPPSLVHHDERVSSFRRTKPFSTATPRTTHLRSQTIASNAVNSSCSPRRKPRRKQQAQAQPQKQKQKQARVIPITEAKTMGEALQMARSISDHLFVADKFIWLPTDDNLQPHLRTQLIHHEKRRRWGSQLLEGLGLAALDAWESNPTELHTSLLSLEGVEGTLWTDERFVRAVMSVAMPMKVEDGEATMHRPEKEGTWVAAALKGLHVLSGCITPTPPSSSHSSSSAAMSSWMRLHESISSMIQSLDKHFDRLSLKDATEVRWAIRGLTARLQIANALLPSPDADTTPGTNPHFDDRAALDFTTPNLNERTASLPFDIIPHCLQWQMDPSSPSNNYYGYPTQSLVPDLLHSIPFNFDTLTTRTGNSVIERRGTAWLAEEGIGALAYSGKLMRPAEVPELVREIMRDMETWCAEQGQAPSISQMVDLSDGYAKLKWDCASSLPYQELGQFLQSDDATFFDCALCNHYPDGDSACKFHTDPEHGSHWHPTTCVVSCGTSRGFAFRPIPDVSYWSEWDGIDPTNVVKDGQQNENTPAALQLFPGDVVFMSGECNDVFHHAVYSSRCDQVGVDSSRVSLVFKRALDRGGKRGHGLKGEGRRSRQRKRM